MKVCVILFSMVLTVDPIRALRFSEAALSGRARPGHRPAGGHAKRRTAAGIALPVSRWRLADNRPKRPAERPEAVEPDREADLSHRPVRFPQHLHRPLDTAALQVTVRGLPERRTELPAEVGRRDVCDVRDCGYIEWFGERAVHRIARLTFPSRLELKSLAGSSSDAPLKKVSLTLSL